MGIQSRGLGHVAMHAGDPRALANFYCDLFGFEVTGHDQGDGAVFVSTRPDEEPHEIAFFRAEQREHIAVKVDSLHDLRALYGEIRRRGLAVVLQADFLTQLSFFIRDPEGNAIEVYWPTGRRGYYVGPHFGALDLDRSEEEILRSVAAGPLSDETASPGR